MQDQNVLSTQRKSVSRTSIHRQVSLLVNLLLNLQVAAMITSRDKSHFQHNQMIVEVMKNLKGRDLQIMLNQAPPRQESRIFILLLPTFSHLYADPYTGGLMPAAYLPQSTIWNPQMVSRVPLPLNLIENGPVFVNAKQFHAIMWRRKQRAKLEAQNKLTKTRKPYLHESRHVHSLKRPRGSGGRFSKKLQEPTEPKHNMPIQQQHTKGNMSTFMAQQLQNSKDRGCSANSGSDITCASDGIDLIGHSEFQISECPSQKNPTMYVHG